MNTLDPAPQAAPMRRRVQAATSASYVAVLLDTLIVNVALDRISVDFGRRSPAPVLSGDPE